eukprot:scaffold51340_cov62-Attheya_sp.AAC.2
MACSDDSDDSVAVEIAAFTRIPTYRRTDDGYRVAVPEHLYGVAYGFEEHSLTMLPLTTVMAFTLWKSQGQILTGKVVLNASDHEREHGLTYFAFSRTTAHIFKYWPDRRHY